MKDDPLNPVHYKGLTPHEPWDVIDTWVKGNHEAFTVYPSLVFPYSNTIKYLSRFSRKKDKLEDLKKAKVYLDKMIEDLENLINQSKEF